MLRSRVVLSVVAEEVLRRVKWYIIGTVKSGMYRT